MKDYRNKKMAVKLLILIFIGLLVSPNLYADQGKGSDILAELKLESEDYFKQENFLEFLEYLDAMRQQKPDEYLPYIDYYSAMTKSLCLDYFEKNEDWKNYYDRVQIFDDEIIATAENFIADYPLSPETVEVQYLAWKAYLRQEDEREEEAFDQLVSQLIKLTEEKKDIAKFQEISERISQEGRITQLNKLFAGYKNYLLRTKADSASIGRLAQVGDVYLNDGRIDMAKVVYEHYIDLVVSGYEKHEAVWSLKEIADKFRHQGFSSGKDADFAEEIYAAMEKELGADSFTGADVFARGYNLEAKGDYQRALEEYKHFVKTFTNSKFLPEVYTRLGIINLYVSGQPDSAIVYFEKVINDFPDFLFASFCRYECALIYQWKKENAKASNLYNQLLDEKGEFADLARQRLQEISSDSGMDISVRHLFDLMFTPAQDSTLVMTLTLHPARVFVNNNVECIGTAQDFSVGTVQPLFAYQWYGDTGVNDSPANTAEMTTAYKTAGPKLICFSAISGDTEGIVCRELWVHGVEIISLKQESTFSVDEPVQFAAEILPEVMPISNLHWQWHINGEEIVSQNTKRFSYQFKKPGHYEGELEILIGDSVRAMQKFSFDVIE